MFASLDVSVFVLSQMVSIETVYTGIVTWGMQRETSKRFIYQATVLFCIPKHLWESDKECDKHESKCPPLLSFALVSSVGSGKHSLNNDPSQ